MQEMNCLSLRYNHKNKYPLSVLDQTLLPHQETWVSIKEPQDMIEAIQELKVRGAPLIGVAAALALGDFVTKADTRDIFLKWVELLRESRPTAVNLMIAMDRLKNVLSKCPTDNNHWQTAIKEEAESIYFEDVQLCKKIGENGAAVFHDGDRILTHCNTGGLATVGIGTALGVIETAFRQGKKLHVYVDETRPLLQGGRLTTYELDRLEIPYTLICDNMAASLMSQGKITKVIVGSDRIAANGDFANKIGTYGVAVLSHFHKIPFYVAAPYTTLDPHCPTGQDIPIEERKPYEVRGVRGSFGTIEWASSKADVYNPAFDVTPNNLVTGWILDRGIFNQEQIKNGVKQICGQ